MDTSLVLFCYFRYYSFLVRFEASVVYKSDGVLYNLFL